MQTLISYPTWITFVLLILPIPLGLFSDIVGVIFGAIVYPSWLLLIALSTRKFVVMSSRFSIPVFVLRLVLCIFYIISISSIFKYTIPNYLIPVHIVIMFLFATCMATCAKSIVNAETQKENSFVDSLGTFILIWFYPIGVWFIQPRLKTLCVINTGT